MDNQMRKGDRVVGMAGITPDEWEKRIFWEKTFLAAITGGDTVEAAADTAALAVKEWKTKPWR